MKHLISSGIVVVHTQNKIPHFLLLHYPHGHWDFPKGKVEKGESKRETALRELKEETGLTAEIIEGFETELEYLFHQDGEQIKKTVYFLLGKVLSDDVVLSHEHIDYAWLPYEQAREKLTFENAKRVLKEAKSFIT